MCLVVLQLQELTADLSEEHTTSTHATEVLETETAERMRLEKELKELQVRNLTTQVSLEIQLITSSAAEVTFLIHQKKKKNMKII